MTGRRPNSAVKLNPKKIKNVYGCVTWKITKKGKKDLEKSSKSRKQK